MKAIRTAAHTYRCMTFAVATAISVMAAVPAKADNSGDPANAVEFADSLRLAVFGLTADQRLVRFQVATPQVARPIGKLSGLAAGDSTIVGIDFRVQGTPALNLAPGLLYGVGNGGGIYAINTANAQASKVSQLTVALNGASFGVDFNPAANALRIVSDAGQNLSHSIDAGTTASQTALTFPGRAAFAAGGAAYTNNDLEAATATTLFDIDYANDVLAIQSPPAGGVLVSVGGLGVDASAQLGFDIYTNRPNNMTTSNRGFAALTVGGSSALYRVNLTTGKASFAGNFLNPIVDIALPLGQ
jgi:hypothetical protein